MKDHHHAWIGVVILVLSTWGAIAVSWGTLHERVDTLTDLNVERKQETQKCDARITAVENDRRIETLLNAMNGRLVALEVQVSGLREELRGKRR